jgi:hypothetical protein
MTQIFSLNGASYAIQYRNQRAQILMEYEPADLNIERRRNGLKIESRPIRFEIENRAFFESMGLKTIDSLARENISKGERAVEEWVTRHAREGDAIADGTTTIAEIAVSRMLRTIESVLTFIPSEKPKLHWEGGTVDIGYKPDEINYYWDIGGARCQYMPYSLQISVKRLL